MQPLNRSVHSCCCAAPQFQHLHSTVRSRSMGEVRTRARWASNSASFSSTTACSRTSRSARLSHWPRLACRRSSVCSRLARVWRSLSAEAAASSTAAAVHVRPCHRVRSGQRTASAGGLAPWACEAHCTALLQAGCGRRASRQSSTSGALQLCCLGIAGKLGLLQRGLQLLALCLGLSFQSLDVTELLLDVCHAGSSLLKILCFIAQLQLQHADLQYRAASQAGHKTVTYGKG